MHFNRHAGFKALSPFPINDHVTLFPTARLSGVRMLSRGVPRCVNFREFLSIYLLQQF